MLTVSPLPIHPPTGLAPPPSLPRSQTSMSEAPPTPCSTNPHPPAPPPASFKKLIPCIELHRRTPWSQWHLPPALEGLYAGRGLPEGLADHASASVLPLNLLLHRARPLGHPQRLGLPAARTVRRCYVTVLSSCVTSGCCISQEPFGTSPQVGLPATSKKTALLCHDAMWLHGKSHTVTPLSNEVGSL